MERAQSRDVVGQQHSGAYVVVGYGRTHGQDRTRAPRVLLTSLSHLSTLLFADALRIEGLSTTCPMIAAQF